MPLFATPLVSLCILVAVIVIIALIVSLARRDIRTTVKEALRENSTGYKGSGPASQDVPSIIHSSPRNPEVERAKADHMAQSADDVMIRWEQENKDAFSVLDDKDEGVPIEAIWQDELDDEDNERRSSKSYPHCLR
jgi:hypothetical protein